MADLDKIDQLIERSSLGTPQARALQGRTARSAARRVVDEAAQRDRIERVGEPAGTVVENDSPASAAFTSARRAVEQWFHAVRDLGAATLSDAEALRVRRRSEELAAQMIQLISELDRVAQGRPDDVTYWQGRLLEAVDLAELDGLVLKERRKRLQLRRELLERAIGHSLSREGPTLSKGKRAAVIRCVVDSTCRLDEETEDIDYLPALVRALNERIGSRRMYMPPQAERGVEPDHLLANETLAEAATRAAQRLGAESNRIVQLLGGESAPQLAAIQHAADSLNANLANMRRMLSPLLDDEAGDERPDRAAGGTGHDELAAETERRYESGRSTEDRRRG